MSSIDVNNPDFAETLSGSAGLGTQHFSQAVSGSLSVKKIDKHKILVNGELTFLCVTKAVTMNLKLNGAVNNLLNRKYTLGFAANLRINVLTLV